MRGLCLGAPAVSGDTKFALNRKVAPLLTADELALHLSSAVVAGSSNVATSAGSTVFSASPYVPGAAYHRQTCHLQTWFRAPGAPGTTNLSNGVAFQ